jgi:hypothetical protein
VSDPLTGHRYFLGRMRASGNAPGKPPLPDDEREPSRAESRRLRPHASNTLVLLSREGGRRGSPALGDRRGTESLDEAVVDLALTRADAR